MTKLITVVILLIGKQFHNMTHEDTDHLDVQSRNLITSFEEIFQYKKNPLTTQKQFKNITNIGRLRTKYFCIA